MIYRFDRFTLDLSLGRLSRGEEEVAVEPRAFALIRHLVEARDRLVTKDELVESVWDGRFITDTAISTLVKTARRALDDDGKAQRLIRTVHGRGFRFVGAVEEAATAPVSAEAAEPPVQVEAASVEGGQPCIAVLPFRRIGLTEPYGAIADAVPSELISSLSRLRWLKVVARGSTFRFRTETADMEAVRTALGAAYCLTGDVELFGADLALAVELADTRDGRIVWADRLSGRVEEVHRMRTDIVDRVTTAMELQISLHEAARARLRAPQTLDAWSLYHVGLRHMYRFNAADNATAEALFARAVAIDPNFARAHAALSFTSFQSAFVNYGTDRAAEVDNARRHAERCLEIDPVDPFGNFNYGRSFWLLGDHQSGQSFLDRSIGLSPSFSQALYAQGFAKLIAGQAEDALAAVDKAIGLSPLDPFLYAMQAAKGFSLALAGDLEQACVWLDTAARQPGAHYLVLAIAAAINKMARKDERARYWSERSRQMRRDASIEQFFVAFPLRDLRMTSEIQAALRALGFPER